MSRTLLALLLFACTAPAQNNTAGGVDASLAPGFNFISQKHLEPDLTFLTSKPLAGRMSLERGSEVAVEFIAAEFAKAGLKPANGSSYLQPLDLVEYHPDINGMSMTLIQEGRDSRFTYLKEFLGSYPDNVTVRADAVFAGYGITAPEYHYDDYANIDVKGKIAVVFDHEPQENDPNSIFNGVGNTVHANIRLKTLNAQKHGAVGMVVVNEPNRKHPSNIDRLHRIPGFAERYTKFPSQQLAGAETHIPVFTVSDSAAAAILATAGKSSSQLQADIDEDLKSQSRALPGTQIEMKAVNADRRVGTSWNVAGLIEGTDPVLKDETVIYSAHYDHDGIRDGKMFPGADDNGSGTVGVIELARAYMKDEARPKRSVLFIVYAAEERGLLGSYFYTAHPLRSLEKTVAVINFDMIGRNEAASSQTEGLTKISADTSNQLGIIGTVYSPDYRAAIEKQNAAVGLDLTYKWDEDSALNVFQRSDQFPFAIKGVPAMWWFTGFHPDYHQPTDTVEKINFPKMEKILRLSYLTGWYWANGGEAPQFHNASHPTR
jgi:Zn-dependent M28 family amino/carboxypeptidase